MCIRDRLRRDHRFAALDPRGADPRDQALGVHGRAHTNRQTAITSSVHNAATTSSQRTADGSAWSRSRAVTVHAHQPMPIAPGTAGTLFAWIAYAAFAPL